MTIAKTIVDDALRLCNEFSNILDVDPYMQQQGFRRLVTWLERKRGANLYLTPQIPATINDDLKENPATTDGITADLAWTLGPFIQATDFTPTFLKLRKEALNDLYIASKQPTDQQYPETLPVGGGNEGFDSTWTYRFYADNDHTQYDFYSTQRRGEVEFYVADFDSDATLSGTTVSSVVWETIQGLGVVISNESLTNNVATAMITFNDIGVVTFRARATYANNEIKDFLFQVDIREP